MSRDECADPMETPVRFVKGVGERRAELLERLEVRTVGDLLAQIPRRYEDRRRFVAIRDLKSSGMATVSARIEACGWVRPRWGTGYYEAAVSDGTGVLICRWFNARYLEGRMKPGQSIVAYGKVGISKRHGLTMQHPEFEFSEEGEESLNLGRIVPVYQSTENLPQRALRAMVAQAVERYAPLAEEFLPERTLRDYDLPPRSDALREVHFPADMDGAERARGRLAFEEFLCMQLVLVARKIQTERFLEGGVHARGGELARRMVEALPFALTAAQERVIREIRSDLAKPRPMHRLLQGDVGSGKTIVAACAVLDAVESGAQAVLMAPTEILARQHAVTFGRLLEPLGIHAALLTGDARERHRREILAGLKSGRLHMAVGTHAVIQDRVDFHDLGLVIIDEQHKFGVEQRGILYEKGTHPDVLVMTATPIPRTLSMTVYGDLDVSVIDELPAGRRPVVTRVISEAQLEEAYAFIVQQVRRGRQAFLVYPLVAESEALELKSAEEMYRTLSGGPLGSVRMGLLHGQMKPEEKHAVMQSFRQGAVDVLAATTVVEVGVDVPNATVMLIENAERFGLAQLHQLRGRIGRGDAKSYCLLQGEPGSKDAWRRLKVMESTTDGFRIAEEDLKIRGMGNLLGREQSGIPLLRVGDPLHDSHWLREARREAFRILEADPRLLDPDHVKLREQARAMYRRTGAYFKVG
jgi:ATP-dependent DNA helicase RecG